MEYAGVHEIEFTARGYVGHPGQPQWWRRRAQRGRGCALCHAAQCSVFHHDAAPAQDAK
jgi:hypothetical protein